MPSALISHAAAAGAERSSTSANAPGPETEWSDVHVESQKAIASVITPHANATIAWPVAGREHVSTERGTAGL